MWSKRLITIAFINSITLILADCELSKLGGSSVGSNCAIKTLGECKISKVAKDPLDYIKSEVVEQSSGCQATNEQKKCQKSKDFEKPCPYKNKKAETPCQSQNKKAETPCQSQNKKAETSCQFKKDKNNDSEKSCPATIISVSNHVYLATGFASSNVIIVEGPEGLVVVDTTDSEEAAVDIIKQVQKLVNKPVKAIILSDFHTNHILGCGAILKLEKAAGNTDIKVYRHTSSKEERSRLSLVNELSYIRTKRQHGVNLNGNQKINSAIKIEGELAKNVQSIDKFVTNEYSKRESYTRGGVYFELIHTPGETNDLTTAWFPDYGLLLPGDNIYAAFPNLYSIQGIGKRDAKKWYKSLDLIRSLKAEFMVPSHAAPVYGVENVREVLTLYRDSIQFVHDQTVRLMNKQVDIDDIIYSIRLPEKLSTHSYLQESYGTLPWSIRGVYESYMGWFDGQPENIYPLSKAEKAKRIGELLTEKFSCSSGISKLIMEAQNKYNLYMELKNVDRYKAVKDLQWAVEVASYALSLSAPDSDELKNANSIMIKSVRELGELSLNPLSHNYYITYARELEDGKKIRMSQINKFALIKSMAIDDLMEFLPTKFKSEKFGNENLVVVFKFLDLNHTFVYTIRNSIIQVENNPKYLPCTVNVAVQLESCIWRKILVGEKNTFSSYSAGEIHIEGSCSTLDKFLNMLDKFDCNSQETI